MDQPVRRLVIEPLEGCEHQVGVWLWALQDVRRRLLKRLEGVSQEALDDQPPGTNGIGTLLYHIAAIEVDWLYVDILGLPFPPETEELFSIPVHTPEGWLTPVTGMTLQEHLNRLELVRRDLLTQVKPLTLEQWRAARAFPDRLVSPEWAIYHLVEHEAHHAGQIAAIKEGFARQGIPL